MNPKNVVVVDNNSDDFEITKKLCQKYRSTFLKLDSNIGYGGAINRGVEILSEEIQTLIISNPDTELNLNAVLQLHKQASKKLIGLVGPKIIDSEGNVYPSARNYPSFGVGIGHAIFSGIWPSNTFSKKYKTNSHLSTAPKEVDWLSGACLAVKKSTFDKIKGFDERYFMYFEDVDMAYRLSKLGYKCIFLPTATVKHKGGQSTKKYRKKMIKIHHQSAKKFLAKKYNKKYWIPILAIVNLALTIRAVTVR